MDPVNRMISGVIKAATSPLGAVGIALQATELSASGGVTPQVIHALRPFKNLFPASDRLVRYYPSSAMPWSPWATPASRPSDITALLSRVRTLFPQGVPQAETGPPPAESQEPLQAMFASAQKLLASDNPDDQLKGQEQLQRYQTLTELFTTLLTIEHNTKRMIIENAGRG